MNPRYILLETNIPYDWDDYDVWGAVAYDIVDNKIVTNKCGHGSGFKWDGEVISLKSALESGVSTEEKLIDVMFNALGLGNMYLYDKMCKFNRNNALAIPCKVIRGRKYRGDAYLMYGIAEPVRYGLGAYRNEYNYYPILMTLSGEEVKINSFDYLQFDNNVKEEWSKAARNAIENTIESVLSLAHLWAYGMSYSARDSQNRQAYIENYQFAGHNAFKSNNFVTECINKINEAENKAYEDLKAQKLPEIIEWVKNNTDKTEEQEIIELAEHIFYKHNPRN